ncbi:hypothetical protein [Clostridium sp. Cult2]|uniref:hypothetical protein n=1 Tax=Clostridium sp. Cult2 TaxID=2079003 RepID=UPI001F257B73|nr:hypothetical protein [Clostridium sp. Cult2]MCF6464513.1 hypothetical protein [Clostridium sp. Cult2]
MFFSKKLKILGIEVDELKDQEIYLCLLKDRKRNIIDDDPMEIPGKELKYLAEMQGQKYGMIRYSSEHFYEVIGIKEEAPI